jgi:hypothetical protein
MLGHKTEYISPQLATDKPPISEKVSVQFSFEDTTELYYQNKLYIYYINPLIRGFWLYEVEHSPNSIPVRRLRASRGSCAMGPQRRSWWVEAWLLGRLKLMKKQLKT